jgi:hypothetical protein
VKISLRLILICTIILISACGVSEISQKYDACVDLNMKTIDTGEGVVLGGYSLEQARNICDKIIFNKY